MIIFILSCVLIFIGVSVPAIPFARRLSKKTSHGTSLPDIVQRMENRWDGIQAEIQHLFLERELGYLDDRQYQIELQQQQVAVSEMLEDCKPWEYTPNLTDAIMELEIIATRLRIEIGEVRACQTCAGRLNANDRLCPNCGMTVFY